MARKNKNVEYYSGVGRRKESIARVRLYLMIGKNSLEINKVKVSKGKMIVNGKNIEDYFPSQNEKQRYLEPLVLTGTEDRFGISIKVKGGGKSGQLDAVINGLAKALVEANKEEYKGVLRKNELITRDPRVKERRKVGHGGKARRKKQSPKR